MRGEELSREEIAERLDMPVAAVRFIEQRALKKLERIMRANGDAPEQRERPKPTSGRGIGVRRCGTCGEVGHNRATCKSLGPSSSAQITPAEVTSKSF